MRLLVELNNIGTDNLGIDYVSDAAGINGVAIVSVHSLMVIFGSND